MGVDNKGLIVLLTGIAYYLLFLLNNLLFSSLGYSDGVNWIFLPSGLRLAFVLVFVEWGALGIVLASIAISFQYYFNGDALTVIGAGVISGFAPWLARLVCMDRLRLNMNLENLSPATLFKVAALFAVMSPVLHQLWFTWRGHTTHFINSTLVMAVGDFVGTVVMLFVARFVLNQLPDLARR